MTIPVPLTDAELIARTRAGEMTAYDELYRRHVDSASRVAQMVTNSAEEAQDVVSEAFTRVLDRLQHGGGPETELSPYLNTIVRRLAIDRYRASRQDGVPADPTLFEVMPVADDPIARSPDRDLVRRAYETLPDRWQQVLWHTEIEGRSPASLAPALGSTPNAVAALAYRAREGLRQAYLSVHLSAEIPAECRPYVVKLAAYVRSTLSPREDQWVAAHLETCPHCRDRRDELMLLVADLRSVLWPALLLPVFIGGTTTAAAVAGATGAAITGVSGARAGAATGVTPGVAAAPAVGVVRWFATIPKPKTLAGQVATVAASIGAVSAVIVATAVIGSDEEPPSTDDSSIAAPFDPGGLGPPASVPRPTPSAVTTPSPTLTSIELPPVDRPTAVPVADLPNNPAPAGSTEDSAPTGVAAPPVDTAPTSRTSSSGPSAGPTDTPPPTDLPPTESPPPTTDTPPPTDTPTPTDDAPPTDSPPPSTDPPPPTDSPPPSTEPPPPTDTPPPPTEPPPPDAPPWWCQWFPWWPIC